MPQRPSCTWRTSRATASSERIPRLWCGGIGQPQERQTLRWETEDRYGSPGLLLAQGAQAVPRIARRAGMGADAIREDRHQRGSAARTGFGDQAPTAQALVVTGRQDQRGSCAQQNVQIDEWQCAKPPQIRPGLHSDDPPHDASDIRRTKC